MKKNLLRILQFQYGRKSKVTTLEIHNLNNCSYTWTPSLHSGHFDVFDTKRWDLCFFVHTFSNVILLWSDARLLILTKLKVLEKYPKTSHTQTSPKMIPKMIQVLVGSCFNAFSTFSILVTFSIFFINQLLFTS